MSDPVLVIMAAGMGSRYGGLKQIDPVGVHGEKIIDFSLFDARRAGFKKALFIIKEELLPDFQEAVFKKASQYLEIDWVFQKLQDVPEGVTIPEGRVKPWGTGHAALTAARVLGDAPYAVINADDFYGREAFEKMYHFLKNAKDGERLDFAMVGYYLKNTVTENGYVSRGVCQTENGMLQSITERTHIEKRGDGIAYTEDGGESWTQLAPDSVVSMNLWGFTPGFTPTLEADFRRFFREDVPKNPEKAEFFLPFVVNDLLAQDKAQVTVLSSSDKWYGVTYKEDKETVVNAIRAMTEAGIYPSPLWN
ncbi:phosphotransferase enzyme family [Clostridium sp. CAG:1013]|nr:phosphotransferase enzyme family [Clostridium sp. CAG:1013]